MEAWNINGRKDNLISGRDKLRASWCNERKLNKEGRFEFGNLLEIVFFAYFSSETI